MGLARIMAPLIPNALSGLQNKRRSHENSGSFAFESDDPAEVKRDIQSKYDYDGELLDIFTCNSSLSVHKWHHYIPIYDRYFASFRGRPVRLLEIGVDNGGSLQMWRSYFGDDAIIFGIDINPACESLNGLHGQVRVGSQVDVPFLDAVVEEMGGLDIVLDDGSHQMRHIPATLEALFPHLSQGGIYMIEDLHAAYWGRFGGGYRSRTNFFVYVRDILDDMHHWYHPRGSKHAIVSDHCSGVHVHDSIVVLDKGSVFQPVNSRIA